MRVVRDFLSGVALYWTGVRHWRRDPASMALGLVPGLLTAIGFGLLVVAVGWRGDDVARWAAARIAGDSAWADLVEVVVALALIGGVALLIIYAFVTVTSIVGQPFFEHLSHGLDDALGPVPAGPGWPWWFNAFRGVGEALRIGMLTVPLSAAVALIGLIPVAGVVIAWTLALGVGGWFVALEFTAIPFERRGLRLAQRRKILARKRARTVGFGAMAYLMAVFAPIAVLMMPAAVAGGTHLARRALDEEFERAQTAAAALRH